MARSLPAPRWAMLLSLVVLLGCIVVPGCKAAFREIASFQKANSRGTNSCGQTQGFQDL